MDDEQLYREMNPEDPWYMGDEPDEDYEDYDDEDSEYDDEEDSRRSSFLLVWKPKFKKCHFSLDEYANTREQYGKRFTLHRWPIDWPDNVIEGDHYYMVRLDDETKGIVWHGTFASEPYIDKSKNGRGKRWFVDINVEDAVKPGERPLVTLDEMRELNNEENWERLNSGQTIAPEMADRFDEIAAANRFKESHPYRGYTSKAAYEEDLKRQFRNDIAGCLSVIAIIIFGILAFAWLLS